MRAPLFLTILAGAALGGLLVGLLPEDTLFTSATPRTSQAIAGERWACAMMDFTGDQPGDCPVCGMKLQRVTAGELTPEQSHRIGLETSRVVRGPAVALVRAYGAVRYDERTARPVIPRIEGRIVQRHAATSHMGNRVRTGDPLVDVYSPQVYAAQSELAAAMRIGDGRARDALVARFERWNLRGVAQAILDGKPPVDTVTLISPYDGIVIAAKEGSMEGSLPEVGSELMAGQPLIRLIDPHAFMVVVHVPETRARWVREGQPVKLASDDMGELPDVAAEVSWVAPELNLEIRAREVHLHLSDPHERLLPGSLVNARFQAALGADLRAADPAVRSTWGQFLLVPKTAVLSTGVRHVVWKVAERQSNGNIRFALAPVALGPRLEDESGNDLFVIRAGLAENDEVATQGAFLVDSQSQLAGTPSLLFPMGASAPAAGHAH